MAQLELSIRGGTVVTPSGRRRLDVGVSGGQVVHLGPDVPPAARSVDATSMRVTAASCRSVNSAPFGCPVVPDVKTMATGRSGWSGRTVGAVDPAPAASRSSTSSAVEISGPARRRPRTARARPLPGGGSRRR